MLTFKQWCLTKRRITQEQRAQIPNRETAGDIVGKMISDALMQNHHELDGLIEEDLDRIFYNQPVYFDGWGFVPHYFRRQNLREWSRQMSRYLNLTK